MNLPVLLGKGGIMMAFFTIIRNAKGLSLTTEELGQVLHLWYQQT
jgi:hypothetical protein